MRPRVFAASALLCSLASAAALAAEPPATPGEFFQKSLSPFVAKYCADCHSGEDAEGEVRLDAYKSAAEVAADPKTFERVVQMLRDRAMPPEDMPQPDDALRHEIVRWIEARLAEAHDGRPNPGCVTLRRLNRAEYANTVRDLVGVEFSASDDFPADDVGYGFDNIGDVLTLSPILMEKYLAATEEIAAQAVTADRLPAPENIRGHVERLASRAYRRPVEPDEVDRLMELGQQAHADGASYEQSARLVLEAILVSPRFLFKVEVDPPSAVAGEVRPLSDFELATRLSYFLWSSMPDESLFEDARRGQLRENLDAQVRRMLADAKSGALVENFAEQWLQLRNLEMAQPDAGLFPAFDEQLRQAMRTESRMFFANLIRKDRSVLELIDADYTFVNERLARHYGIEGDSFRKVSLAGTPRGGVITQASVLLVTSNPTRTSPVKRGKWILENILGTPPPDPPPGVPALKNDPAARLSGSLRQRMEQHRADPTCAVCHKKMDALGFAMENFDAVGAWRTRDGNFPVDPSGELPDGQTFSGPAELKQILRHTARDDFLRCLSEKMLTYATGRGLEGYDRPAVDRITQALGDDPRFSTLILEIARSDPFQKRRMGGNE